LPRQQRLATIGLGRDVRPTTGEKPSGARSRCWPLFHVALRGRAPGVRGATSAGPRATKNRAAQPQRSASWWRDARSAKSSCSPPSSFLTLLVRASLPVRRRPHALTPPVLNRHPPFSQLRPESPTRPKARTRAANRSCCDGADYRFAPRPGPGYMTTLTWEGLVSREPGAGARPSRIASHRTRYRHVHNVVA
jgi:hypothetical protein